MPLNINLIKFLDCIHLNSKFAIISSVVQKYLLLTHICYLLCGSTLLQLSVWDNYEDQ